MTSRARTCRLTEPSPKVLPHNVGYRRDMFERWLDPSVNILGPTITLSGQVS